MEDKRKKADERCLDLSQANRALHRLPVLPHVTIGPVKEAGLEHRVMPFKAE